MDRHREGYRRDYNQKYKEQRSTYAKKYRQEHREHLNKIQRQYRLRKKIEVLTHYGNGKLACVKCGFDDIRALSIDHIEGGGLQHRRSLGVGYDGFYCWLRRQDYPKGYQTLCFNCQMIKRAEKGER